MVNILKVWNCIYYQYINLYVSFLTQLRIMFFVFQVKNVVLFREQKDPVSYQNITVLPASRFLIRPRVFIRTAGSGSDNSWNSWSVPMTSTIWTFTDRSAWKAIFCKGEKRQNYKLLHVTDIFPPLTGFGPKNWIKSCMWMHCQKPTVDFM